MAAWQDEATRYETDMPPDEPLSPAEEAREQTTQADAEWPIPREFRVAPYGEDVLLSVNGDAAQAERASSIVALAAPHDRAAARRRRFVAPGADVLAALVLLAALALGGGAWVALHRQDPQPSPDTVRSVSAVKKPAATGGRPVRLAPSPRARRASIPYLKGATLTAAKTVLARAGLRVSVRQIDSSAPKGTVLRQTPASGADIQRGKSVLLVVSAGAPRTSARVVVPSVVGGEVRFATQTLRADGLRPALQLVRSSGDLAGTVLGQSPRAGARTTRGSIVRLRVAKAESSPPATSKTATVPVPDLAGMQVSNAKQRLVAAGLHWKLVPVDSNRPQGEIVNQSPGPQVLIRKGGLVTLEVSSGPALVEVPDVTGLDEESARRLLADGGFDVAVVYEQTTDPSQDGLVTDESPASGTQSTQGQTVTITVASFGG